MKSEAWQLTPIAHILTDFDEKFGIPRQSGLVPEATGKIIFTPAYRDANAVKGIEQFSHLWLIWQFSEVADQFAEGRPWRPTVRPPRLGGNTRLGVFATRSPYRPNALGLSCVELAAVHPQTPQGPVLIVRGADLLNGTPIYDIKPYLPYVDARPDAAGGFSEQHKNDCLIVQIDSSLLAGFSEDQKAALTGLLAQDPRPAYQEDPHRLYSLSFAGRTVQFTVSGLVLTVTAIF